jgi:cell wall-active antibiotic response 4TMS protein YvqF/uncharacterized protein DUF1707
MADSKRKPQGSELVVSMDVERQRAIDLLSEHFAQDNISIEELERRIADVYRAGSVPALRDLTRDLPGPGTLAPRPPVSVADPYAPELDRIVSFMGNTKRRGVWRPARQLDVWSVMSETHIDLTEALLVEGVTEIEVHAIMASVKIIVPPGVRVVMQAGSFMAEVNDDSETPPAVGSGAPVVRVTGFAFMSELKVRVRHRELSP